MDWEDFQEQFAVTKKYIYMNNTLAQHPTPLGAPIGGDGLGPLAKNLGGPNAGLEGVSKIISTVIGAMTIVAGIWFLFQFLVGGFNWISSSGDKAKLEDAQKRITNAFIGLVIVVAAWTILAIVSIITGVDFLLSKPGAIINMLRI